MKKLIPMLLFLIAGVAVGGGSGYAAQLLLGPKTNEQPQRAEEAPTVFVPLPRMVAPLVARDGHLSGYVAFELQLQVREEDAAAVTAKLPFLQHAINLRTYRTPLAAGPDGALPDIEIFRKLTRDAAAEAFGKDVVRKVAVTQATPA